jgi:EAL domain-containing protein (putative c-di-GMP-specific phosphodiesterase class I)
MLCFGIQEKKALVVDDHAFVRKSAESILNRIGITDVTTAENGIQAREAIYNTSTPFEFILCDLSMPDEDGFVLLRELADMASGAKLIIMSGEESEVLQSALTIARNRRLQVLGSVKKPLSIEKLKTLLGHDVQQPKKHIATSPLSSRELRSALLDDLVEVWFQPQFNVHEGRPYGVEALARIKRKEEIISPDRFIPTAEKNGMMAELTEAIIYKAMEQCAPYIARHKELVLSLNVSPVGLKHSFPDHMRTLCASFNIRPSNIVLEVTETAISSDKTTLLEILARLRLMKFRLSIDDFGTGFSSLSQLKGLPFHELKVDKSFVQDALTNPKSHSILKNSLRLANDLKLNTVAEGVETAAQQQLIQSLGCHLVQGYHIARPMPIRDCETWWRKSCAATIQAACE